MYTFRRTFSTYSFKDHIELEELRRLQQDVKEPVDKQIIEVHRPARNKQNGIYLGINHPTAWIKSDGYEIMITKENFNKYVSDEQIYVLLILVTQELIIRSINMRKYGRDEKHQKARVVTLFYFLRIAQEAKKRGIW
jgi:hypothetical protein